MARGKQRGDSSRGPGGASRSASRGAPGDGDNGRRAVGQPRKRKPGRQRSELRARIMVAVPAIIFAIFVVAWGGAVFTLAAAALGLICLHELFTMYERARPVRLAATLGVIGLAVAAHFGGPDEVMLATIVSIPLVFVCGLLVNGEKLHTAGMSITVLGLTWIGLAIAHSILLRNLPHGDGIMIDVLVGTFAGDTAAYLGGRAFGSRKLAPTVSPNKTVEGLAIGVVTAVIATWCAGLYQDWLGHGQALLLGLAVGLAAPLGDLLESKVKRDAGVKDAGKLFGAHGGALDRLDAALFALIAGYYVWKAMLG